MSMLPFISIVEDLSKALKPAERYERLIDAIAQAIECDAVVLLELKQNMLVPLAAKGLSEEVMGRRFDVEKHPRLKNILESDQPVRFEAACKLPDPYDGLVADSEQLHVHDCMGSSIYVDGDIWGALTLDAMKAGTFDALNPTETRAYVAAVAAAIKTSLHIEALEAKASQQHEIAQSLMHSEAQDHMIGESDAMQALVGDIDTVAPSLLSVLITGETGVGKELVARQIHDQSGRASEVLVQINCAALPENIVESELFGHVKGAFSGAVTDRSGRFELADGGTLFLDEVGELPLGVQAKLLRTLQSGEIQRVGSDRIISVDVRIIAATNRNLQEEVKAGRFRADLYHRLSVYPLPVPALKERGKDVLLLAGYFLEKNQHRLGLGKVRLSASAVESLLSYSWPGNVRELEHILSRATLKASRDHTGADMVTVGNHHLALEDGVHQTLETDVPIQVKDHSKDMRELVDGYQRQLIADRLEYYGDNLSAVARSFGVDRSNLLRTMKRLGLR
ncbi:nitric oxide reductase transcriptional regulator NorR [Kordiimonas laminariae]|uniref:nitric oxide reductase transcriptional regulator NorR n=1 Tax=Kordiimonas laminariae TaxID=2917717 RepID=UPI001FF482F8|nr:nitric oxide reductase transcriptional regulator NorR [Kordiimonas laminariae]MCK0068101.1 nitric oxide reductase transcriptional regulator NorR [Kordiimonas laminariae]